MKKIKLAVVRQIVTEEFYEVLITDARAKEIEVAHADKTAIADMVSDDYQCSKRTGNKALYKETTVSDVVTFVKMKFTEVKE